MNRNNRRRKKHWKRLTMWCAAALLLALFAGVLLARKPEPERIIYGISFNTPYAQALGLDPREVYSALLDELGVRHLRLAAHWTMVEPEDGTFDFAELDWQIARARERGANVILALGRRLPRWPECHIPAWASSLSWEEQKEEIRLYIREVVDRYKDEPHISYWQVENEPYLEIFAHEQCGDFDEAFFKEEIELVRSLDGMRPILVTDSGNLGTWSGAYSAADAFGTSVYVYFWNQNLGQFRTILPPVIYRIKENLMTLFHGRKPTFLIELSLEPWLIAPVTDVAVETQLERMNPEKFDEIIVYARQTRYDRQYLWGAEWWYWLKARGYPEMWEKGKELFRQ